MIKYHARREVLCHIKLKSAPGSEGRASIFHFLIFISKDITISIILIENRPILLRLIFDL